MFKPPCVFVIMGASGDLAYKKLIPAIYSLASDGYLHKDTRILGVARTEIKSEDFNNRIKDGVDKYSRHGTAPGSATNRENWSTFVKRLSYHRMADMGALNEYKILADIVLNKAPYKDLERVVIYLALPPSVFHTVITNLGESGLNNDKCTIVVEKPLGSDLHTAMDLEKVLHSQFKEEQIARIDHYLGKMQALNMMGFRFSNAFVEPIWNDKYIDRIIITASEEIDVNGRISYYDANGIIIDMVQSHLLQLLALTTMEAPIDMSADGIRNEKVKLLKSIDPIRVENVLTAQYEGYLKHEGVPKDSLAPTAVCLRVSINNARWKRTQFIIQTCKCGATRETRIDAVMRPSGSRILNTISMVPDPNIFSFLVHPTEGIQISFETMVPSVSSTVLACDNSGCIEREPGPFLTKPVTLDFDYQKSHIITQSAYERLLQEVVAGDLSNFTRTDEVIAQWKIVANILDNSRNKPIIYAKGLRLLHPICLDAWKYGKEYIRRLAYGHCRLRVAWEITATAILACETVSNKIIHSVALWAETHSLNNKFDIILAGGITPKPCYEHMSRHLIKHLPLEVRKRIFVWLSDEREDTDARNNGKMIKECFKDSGVVINDIYDGTKSFEVSAREYSKKIGEVEFFRAAILGIGTDGHICSLFPGCLPILTSKDDQCIVIDVPQLGERRATITPLVIQRIKDVIILATGEDKTTALTRLAYAPFQPSFIPAQLATAQSSTTVVCDHTARSSRPIFN